MVIPLLNDESLKSFIQKSKISQKNKDFLLAKLPELGPKGRKILLEGLTDIALLGLEEERELERLKKFWGK